ARRSTGPRRQHLRRHGEAHRRNRCGRNRTANRTRPVSWLLRITSELDAADRHAGSVARGLNAIQLNWRPRQDAWSVGQCLEHLRVANEVYLPALAAALDGREPGRADDVTLGGFSRWVICNYIAPSR